MDRVRLSSRKLRISFRHSRHRILFRRRWRSRLLLMELILLKKIPRKWLHLRPIMQPQSEISQWKIKNWWKMWRKLLMLRRWEIKSRTITKISLTILETYRWTTILWKNNVRIFWEISLPKSKIQTTPLISSKIEN